MFDDVEAFNDAEAFDDAEKTDGDEDVVVDLIIRIRNSVLIEEEEEEESLREFLYVSGMREWHCSSDAEGMTVLLNNSSLQHGERLQEIDFHSDSSQRCSDMIYVVRMTIVLLVCTVLLRHM